jgi:hypothetical protein
MSDGVSEIKSTVPYHTLVPNQIAIPLHGTDATSMEYPTDGRYGQLSLPFGNVEDVVSSALDPEMRSLWELEVSHTCQEILECWAATGGSNRVQTELLRLSL